MPRIDGESRMREVRRHVSRVLVRRGEFAQLLLERLRENVAPDQFDAEDRALALRARNRPASGLRSIFEN